LRMQAVCVAVSAWFSGPAPAFARRVDRPPEQGNARGRIFYSSRATAALNGHGHALRSTDTPQRLLAPWFGQGRPGVSSRLDIRGADDVAPLFGFVGNELAEIRR